MVMYDSSSNERIKHSGPLARKRCSRMNPVFDLFAVQREAMTTKPSTSVVQQMYSMLAKKPERAAHLHISVGVPSSWTVGVRSVRRSAQYDVLQIHNHARNRLKYCRSSWKDTSYVRHFP